MTPKPTPTKRGKKKVYAQLVTVKNVPFDSVLVKLPYDFVLISEVEILPGTGVTLVLTPIKKKTK